MKSYSSAKLELLTLKWAVCDKFKDYLLGSKFTVLTDNNPLCYVKTSKLGASQIRWLSDLALFYFDIKYQVGRKNQVADTLSHHPLNPDSSSESGDDDDNWETISYGMVCQSINHLTDSMKILFDVKYEIQNNEMETSEVNEIMKLFLGRILILISLRYS